MYKLFANCDLWVIFFYHTVLNLLFYAQSPEDLIDVVWAHLYVLCTDFYILLDYISGQEEDNQPNVDPVREQTLALFFFYI